MWLGFGVTYADGNVSVFDPTVRFHEDSFQTPYASYDTVYSVNLAGFLVVSLILFSLVLLVANAAVFTFMRLNDHSRPRDN